MLHLLLWKQRSSWQTFGAVAGSCIGIFLMLLAMQVRLDVSYLTEGGGQRGEFVSINKQVNLLNTLGIKPVFGEKDLENIKSQPFVEAVAPYVANRYKVSARIDAFRFYTDLFFEALPTEMVDIDAGEFVWSEGMEALPIVMSRDYLALYNFGFAVSQGLPQLTAGSIGKVSVDITLYGQGRALTFKGRIVGFSDRINSILVPDSFQKWANAHVADQPDDGPSRLLLRVNNPSAPAFADFLSKEHYEIGGGRLIGGKAAAVLQLVTAVLAFLGVLIVLLSLLVFVLHFQLRVSTAAPDIRLLLQVGYKHRQISNFLAIRWLGIFGASFLVAFAAVWLLRYKAGAYFVSQGFDIPEHLHVKVVIAGLITLVLLSFLNVLNIRRQVLKLF